MRVLYLTNSPEIGGGNRQLEALWEGVRGQGIEPVAVCPAAGPMVDLCRKANVAVEVVPYLQPSWKEPIATIRACRVWEQLLRRANPDVIHANDFANARSVCVPVRRRRLPLLCHVHFPADPETLRWMFRGLPKPDIFVYNSASTRSVCEPVLAQTCRHSRHVLVYNGVSALRFHPAKHNGHRRHPPRVGIIANLLPVKGHMDFLEMARLLMDRQVGAEYWIIGADIHQSGFDTQLRRRCAELGLSEQVRFLGHRSDVPDLLQQLDVVVCASHEEPFGLCLIEAMACEIAVVGTRVGGVTEVIDPGVTGFLVAPRAPHELADRVRVLLADAGLRQRMGQAGRSRMLRLFSQDAHVTRMRAVYEGLRH